LGKKALWELHAAQAEIEGVDTEQVAREKLLDASALMTTDDLEELLDADPTDYETKRLAALAQTRTTDSRHFRAVGKPETHDLAYRVWKLDSSLVGQQYRQLMQSYPKTRPVDQVGTRSFTAQSPGILAHVFMDKKHSVVLSLTCGIKLCSDQKAVRKVAKLLHSRLDLLKKKREADQAPDVDLDQYRKKRPSKFMPRLDQ
jgi:hypothetical protein